MATPTSSKRSAAVAATAAWRGPATPSSSSKGCMLLPRPWPACSTPPGTLPDRSTVWCWPPEAKRKTPPGVSGWGFSRRLDKSDQREVQGPVAERDPILMVGAVLQPIGRLQEDLGRVAAFLLRLFHIDLAGGQEHLVDDLLQRNFALAGILHIIPRGVRNRPGFLDQSISLVDILRINHLAPCVVVLT